MYIIVALIITVITFSLFYQRKTKKYESELSEQKSKYDRWLYDQKNGYERQLYEQKGKYETELCAQHDKAEQYRNELGNNLREEIPSGEVILINNFRELFESPSFKDFIIYNQLQFVFEGKINKVDFLIVSPKGFFVVESKCWKGVTYFYSKDYRDMFSQTDFDSFGVGSGLGIRVFNVQEHEDEKGKLVISKYSNPVAQVRGYSHALKEILPVENGMLIKNIVVFNKLKKFTVFYNDKPLESQPLDSFSTIIIDTNMKKYFDSFQCNHRDTKNAVDYIERNLGYKFKMDINNYKQAPFDLIYNNFS